MTLSRSAIEAYDRDGYLAPLDAMEPDQAARYRARLESFERAKGGTLTEIDRMYRFKTHLLLPWVADLVRQPRLLDAVGSIIGPHILCWTCTWFIKEPGSEALTVWHQDATYFGLRPHRHITAWLALTPSGEDSGCVRFVPGSNHLGQLRHVAHANPNSINGGGQGTEREFSPDGAVPAVLEPGQFSLHHTLCVHSSGPNRSRDRRIGLGVSYIPADVRHIGTRRMPATLVRGTAVDSDFLLEPGPSTEAGEAAHARHYRRYREGYDEQIEWHRQGKGWEEHA